MRERVIVGVRFVCLCLSVCVQRISKVTALRRNKPERDELSPFSVFHFLIFGLALLKKAKKLCRLSASSSGTAYTIGKLSTQLKS